MAKLKKKKDIRHGRLLTRGMGEGKSLAFAVCLEVEENEPEANDDSKYIATVLHLEPGTVIGAGPTGDDAERDAISLFCAMVDSAIERDRLAEFIGDAGIMKEIDLPVEEFARSLASLQDDVAARHGEAQTTAERRPPMLNGRRVEERERRSWLRVEEQVAACG